MSSDPRGRVTPLTVVGRSPGCAAAADASGRAASEAPPGSHELDWSILMAHAQGGNAVAYRHPLEAVAPYLRSLAARWHRDQGDVEDAVQDILLTIHAIRHTYDPTRPFGPWLVAISKRQLIDRLRRQGRLRSRETTLEARHETFPAPETNLYPDDLERRALCAAVEALPPRQREAITPLKLQELSLKEASAASGMSIASLKVSAHRGIKSRKKLIQKERGDA